MIVRHSKNNTETFDILHPGKNFQYLTDLTEKQMWDLNNEIEFVLKSMDIERRTNKDGVHPDFGQIEKLDLSKLENTVDKIVNLTKEINELYNK